MDNVKEIKAFFKGLSESNSTSRENVEEILFDPQTYQAAIEDVRSRLRVKLSTGFCSSFLIGQIARHYCGIGERFGDAIEFYHGPTILDTIELMENGKLNGREFTKSRLIGGLYKEHHSALSQASFITKNIGNGLNEEVIPVAQERSGGSLFGLLNTLHSDIIARKKKAGKLTGEWIVFAKIGDVKCYLCLATHSEGEGQGEIIYDKITPALEEFPVLAQFKGRN
jgi:hypothetical protein